jgi:hypothetical protein
VLALLSVSIYFFEGHRVQPLKGDIQRAPNKGRPTGPHHTHTPTPNHCHCRVLWVSFQVSCGRVRKSNFKSNSTFSLLILEPLILILWGNGLSSSTHKHHHSPVCMEKALKVATRTSASCTARLAFARTRSASRSSSLRRSSSAWGLRAFPARVPGTS